MLPYASPAVSQGADGDAPPEGWGATGFPIIMYAPETGLGLGAGVAFTCRRAGSPPEARPQTLPLFLIYTTKNQTMVSFGPELYFDEEAWVLRASMAYENFPSSFFGTGNDTPDDAEEEFTIEDLVIQPSILRNVYSHFRVGLGYKLKKTNVLETEDGGVFEAWDQRGLAGGVRSGIGLGVEWDNRDNLFYPGRGGWYQLYGRYYREGLGSDFDYEFVILDLRHYLTIKSGHILALQAYSRSMSGRVPVNDLASLGEIMRGVYFLRYQDLFMAASQAEYRFPISGRVSGAAFTSLGDVSHGRENFSTGSLKFAAGAGLRFLINEEEKINIRLDMGVSAKGGQMYIQFGEAF